MSFAPFARGTHRLEDSLVHDLAPLGNESALSDLVLEVDLEGAVVDQVEEEGGNIFGVHLAGMLGDCRRDVFGSEDLDPVCDHRLPRRGELTVATAFGREVNNH